MALVGGAFRYVVIEGPIGVGKTSLARKLATRYECDLVLEAPQDNPFLERFYRDPVNAALPTQLHFLFQRARQCQALRQSDLFDPVRVADFLLDKDRLFAQLTLDDQELKLYEMVYEKLRIDTPTADLVIYLQAPVATLLDRIRGRGISYEQLITHDYLGRLTDAYTRFFHVYDASPLLIVNTESVDLVSDDANFQQLVGQIETLRSGRRFFNPTGAAP